VKESKTININNTTLRTLCLLCFRLICIISLSTFSKINFVNVRQLTQSERVNAKSEQLKSEQLKSEELIKHKHFFAIVSRIGNAWKEGWRTCIMFQRETMLPWNSFRAVSRPEETQQSFARKTGNFLLLAPIIPPMALQPVISTDWREGKKRKEKYLSGVLPRSIVAIFFYEIANRK